MRRERLIRPTVRAQVCRPDKTRQRRIRQWRSGAGCGVNALSGLRFGHKFVGLIRRVASHQTMALRCRMRRERLIRPTVRAQVCRPDKTRQRRIRQWRSGAGCGVNALSGLRFGHKFVGLIRRVASHQTMALRCRMRRERLIRPTVRAQVCRPDKTRQRRIRQ